MIQCVGCRQEGRSYCARVCCSQAVKNALALKADKPEREIYILFRDMRTYGQEDHSAGLEQGRRSSATSRTMPVVEAVEDGGRSSSG
jgi:heterodisulfide reductase subunit A